MNNKYVRTGIAALLIGTVLLPSGITADTAFAQTPVKAAPSVNYGLTEQIRAAVKNASLTLTELGTQVSVAIRLYNGGGTQNRIPEHELRVRTKSGVSYTLASSAANKTALKPKEIAELVYLAEIDSKEIGEIVQFEFVHVNMYTYPKTEKTLLAIPAGAVWYGLGMPQSANLEKLAWGQSFRIPGINSGIVYTPTDVTIQNSSTGNAAVVTLLAENPGSGREFIPAFRIDGVAEQKAYEGRQSAADPKVLEAGEKDYLHFIIPMDKDVTFTQLLAVSTDVFAGGGGQAMVVSTGKLMTALPTERASAAMTNYLFGQPILFDELSKAVDKQTAVSLVDFQIHENPEEGYKTAVAKYKLTNNSDQPVSTPAFGAEITNRMGTSYLGSRQANVAAMMNPGLSYVINYSFILPQTEEETSFIMKLLDQQAAAPYHTTAASLQVSEPEARQDQTFSLYPFEISINRVEVAFNYVAGTYQYKFNLDLTVDQIADVVVDNGFSRLRFEIVDNAGRIIGTQDAMLTGPNKLISGKQVLQSGMLKSEQFDSPFTVNLYEVIETENGTAKRFLMSVK